MNQKTGQQFQDFGRLWGGFRSSRIILTANNYGIFDVVKKPGTAREIARAIKTDPRATEILLDAITAAGLLKKTGSKYSNTETARKFLVKGSPFYQGDMLRHAESLWKSWSGLDEVVRTGKPNRSGSRDYDAFIRAMHNNAVLRAKQVIDAIDLGNVTRALDLGGGPGTYSMELAKKKIEVALFDLPEAVSIAQDIVGEQKSRQIRFIAGDFHTDDIGAGYDLVLISQILHSLSVSESISLVKKAKRALTPKGAIAIHEFLLDKNRAAPVPGALFSINMLVNTPEGRSYTVQEMKGWLKKAGLKGLKATVLGDTAVITGKKG